MEPVVARLPSALGAFAALVVAFISYLIQVSPTVCLMRALSAFAVFAAFGIVIRYLLGDTAALPTSNHGSSARAEPESRTEDIPPGTPVGDLLMEEESEMAAGADIEK